MGDLAVAAGDPDQFCLSGLSWGTEPEPPPMLPGSPELLAVTINAIEQAAADGRDADIDAVISAAGDGFSPPEIAKLEEAALEVDGTPDTPEVSGSLTESSDRAQAEVSRSVGADARLGLADTDLDYEPVPEDPLSPRGKDGIGDQHFSIWYVYYNVVRTDGTVSLISNTRAELNQAIAVNPDDWGRKDMNVHLIKSTGRNTYYSDVACEIRHVDLFADSTVAHWNCSPADQNRVNYWDTYNMKEDYYGNRGDKYYNEWWFDINPEGPDYDTERANREGPKWRNPDGGGRPYWLR